MYLKSIEVQGFKSFANKILFEFHDGITGIVGPNGSGKSNVADAVRWVLGEQSAKQLRGSSMQDVIFAGTEARKPLGFAYVAITLDNSDHKLPIDFEEVTVARRVYRSGESEYLINGAVCRLRDVQELFMDTGVGKEGYSIIGQGQIDKILSGKPEDRRELFDEAAGIVKFKKRKSIAEKNLEEEKLNLSRVTDIISEIERRIGPLEKQAETAKEYLKYKEELKLVEINQFFLDFENNKEVKQKQEEKLSVVQSDLSSAKEEYESVRNEFEQLTEKMKELETLLEEKHVQSGELQVKIEKADGEIKLINQQLESIVQNEEHYNERIEAARNAFAMKQAERNEYLEKLSENQDKLARINESQADISEELMKLKTAIDARVKSMEGLNDDVFRFLQGNGEIKTEIQHFETLKEQIMIRKAEINQNLLNNKSEEATVEQTVQEKEELLKQAADAIISKTEAIESTEAEIAKLQSAVHEAEQAYSAKVQACTAQESKLESLKNLAERYEGCGSSIRKVMEQKDKNKGIHGVVADLINVEKKYETAVETALGNNIQNIVTDNEQTAKQLIEFLKQNRFGRATFLPLTGIDEGKKDAPEDLSGETGVIGYAGELIETASQYRNVINYLVGRILVVDHIDHAIALQKKYRYSLRIVTPDGEYLTPGGSMSGGAYRNNSNLLGRKRELEELEEVLQTRKQEAEHLLAKKEELRQERAKKREALEAHQRELQDLYVNQNTAKMNLNKEEEKLREIRDEYNSLVIQLKETELKAEGMDDQIRKKQEELQENLNRSEENKRRIENYTKLLEQEQEFEKKLSEQAAALRLEAGNYSGADEFINENIRRAEAELQRHREEIEQLCISAADFENQKKQREADAKQNRIDKENCLALLAQCKETIVEYNAEKERISQINRNFFDKSDDLMKRISLLDQDSFRLQNQAEKLQEQLDASVSYLWEEYELTPTTAAAFKDEECTSATKNKRRISELKNAIRALGDVNVNAIEEYKETSERYHFLTAQRDDIKSAEETLIGIINELDSEMRRQFEEEFVHIKEQFDAVFKELFGGGKGTLELTDGENVLEAGICIIAQPPGKKLQNMMQLSGGEKALTAIALLFAIQNLKPSPFCLVDEIEAALDDSNVKRFAKYLNKLTKETQFIVITHRRGTMAAADRLYGITMQEKGVSALVSVNLIEGELDK